MIHDGNLVISDGFEWSPEDGDRFIDGGPGEDTVVIQATETAGNMTITPTDDGFILISFEDGTTLTLDNTEELEILGTDGDDQIVIGGDFTNTDLAYSTIVVISNEGADLIDASDYESGHRLIAFGGGGDDTIIGGAGDDELYGEYDNDILIGGLGDDLLDGGDGSDTALYLDEYAVGYSVDITGLGSATITDIDISNGDDGTDTLRGIEEVRFADRTYYLDGRVQPPILDLNSTAIGDQHIGSASGNEDFSISLDIQSSLIDLDGSEVLAVEIEGIPVGAVLSDGSESFTSSAGSTLADVSGWDLSSLTITPVQDTVDDFQLSVTVTATEIESGDTAVTQGTIDVVVNAVSDAPDVDVVLLPLSTPDSSGNLFELNLDGLTSSAVLSNGTFAVTDFNNRTSPSIYDDNGNFVGEFHYFGYEFADLTGLSNGGFITAGIEYDLVGRGDQPFGIYLQQNDNNGNVTNLYSFTEIGTSHAEAGDPNNLNYPSRYGPEVTRDYDISVTELSDGSLVLSWTGVLSSQIFHQRFDSDLNPLGSVLQINPTSYNFAVDGYDITALADGGYVAVWDGSAIVVARLYDSTGTPSGEPFLVAPNSVGVPDVVALPDGGFVVVWADAGYDGFERGLGGQRYDGAGDPVGEAFQAASISTDSSLQFEIIALPDGGFLVTWDGSHGQRFDSDVIKVGEEFTFENPGQVIAQPDGGLVVISSVDGEYFGQQIYLQEPMPGGDKIANFMVDANHVSATETEVLSISIEGVPDDASLNAGVKQVDGSWLLSAEDFGHVTLSFADVYSGTVDLTITAIATEPENGDTATIITYLTLPFNVPEEPPQATGFETSIDENILGTTSLGIVDASDDNGTIVNYQITDGNNGQFSIDANGEVFVDGILNHEATDQYALTVTVTDDDGLTANTSVTINVNDVNEIPALSVTNVVTTIDELADVNAAIKVADIAVSDIDAGTNSNTLSLSGDDASMFFIGSTGGLYLNANAALDFDTNPTLDVTVEVDDASVGSNPDDFFDVSITVTEGNHAPSVALTTIQDSIAEDTDTSARILVATAQITDDALGTNVLSLFGDDANLFELDGNNIYLKAGVALDFETNPALDFAVYVDDATIPGNPDGSANFSVNVTDVPEGPSNLTAYDSVYFYHTDSHSIAGGMGLVNPFDGSTLSPNILVDGGATNYVTSSPVNGVASFGDATQPIYTFTPTDVGTFEASGLTGSFTFAADNGGVPVSGNVEITAYTSGTNLTGGDGNDVLVGSGGINTLNGAAGNDILFGKGGNDTINGNDGDDLISGGIGNDIMIGGQGDDQIHGGVGNDTIYYTLSEDNGQDIVEGGDDTDIFTLNGNGTNIEYVNIIAGADGAVLVRDALSDLADWSTARTQTLTNIESLGVRDLSGGSNGFNVTASGDLTGVDQMNFFTYGSGTINVDASGVTSNTIARVTGDIGNDVLLGGAGADLLYAYEGGTDIFDGNSGNDTLRFDSQYGVSSVTADGGADTDTAQLYLRNNGADLVNITAGGATDFTMDVNGTSSSIDNFEKLYVYEYDSDSAHGLDLTLSGDFSNALTSAFNHQIWSFGGPLNIDASGVTSATNFQVTGHGGDDSYIGGAGRDLFFSNYGGDDTFSGGAGDDYVNIDTRFGTASMTAVGGIDTDRISITTKQGILDNMSITSDGSDILSININGIISTFQGFEQLSTFDYTASVDSGMNLTLSGDLSSALNLTDFHQLTGYGGRLYVDASEVTSLTKFGMTGSRYDDILIGGAGKDIINGGLGNDVLQGGLGDNSLQGQDGVDTFVFTAASFAQVVDNALMRDTIQDYTVGETIDLSAVYDYIENNLLGTVDSVVNSPAGGTNSYLRINYTDAGGAHTVDLALLSNFVGAMTILDNTAPAPLAYDSVYIYSGETNSILDADGMKILSPIDGVSLIDPTVWATNGATSYSIGTETDGSASFLSGGPEYDFIPVLGAGFEVDNQEASFTYTATNAAGISNEATVTIKHLETDGIYNFNAPGGDGNDILIGRNLADSMLGNGGDDIMIGNGGTDSLRGGDGNDILSGGVGRDDLYGDGGDDWIDAGYDNDIINYYLHNDEGEDIIDGGVGSDFHTETDQFYVRGGSGDLVEYVQVTSDGSNTVLFKDISDAGSLDWVDARTQTLENIEVIRIREDEFGELGMNLEVSGDFTNTSIRNVQIESYNNGALTVDVSAAIGITAMSVFGNGGDDYFIGGASDDYFTANGGGMDEFHGGDGNDILRFNTVQGVSEVTAYGGAGTDRLITTFDTSSAETASITSDGSNALVFDTAGVQSTLYDFENFWLHSYNDVLDITISGDFSQSLSSTDTNFFQTNGIGSYNLDASALISETKLHIYGGSNSDIVNTGAGNDTIESGAGNDILDGGLGADILKGGDGDDILLGGAGDDTLSGGLDSDIFIFRNGEVGIDIITDFDAAANTGDILDLTDLLSGASIATEDGANLDAYLHFSLSGSNTIVEVDIDGDGSATEQTIQLNNIDLVTGNTDVQIIDSLLAGGNIDLI
jgi:Ca2+-binding RTX toxin-like protein